MKGEECRVSTETLSINDQLLLEKCRDIEIQCRDLYTFFAELYTEDLNIVRLWRKTAMEEQNHADQFTLALKLKKGLSCLVSIDKAKVDSILSQLRTVTEQVKKTPPKLEDALLASIKLEKYIAEFHLSCVVCFENASFKGLFNAMMSSDQGHLEALQAAYDKLTGTQDWTFVS